MRIHEAFSSFGRPGRAVSRAKTGEGSAKRGPTGAEANKDKIVGSMPDVPRLDMGVSLRPSGLRDHSPFGSAPRVTNRSPT